MTTKDIAQELRDELMRGLVSLELEVRFHRLEGRDREKKKAMRFRADIELKLALLDQYIATLT